MERRHRIKEWRKKRKVTQEWLAAQVGTSTASISRIENGKQPYDQRKLEAIAAALECNTFDLLLPPEPDPADLELSDEIRRLNARTKRQAVALLRALNEAA